MLHRIEVQELGQVPCLGKLHHYLRLAMRTLDKKMGRYAKHGKGIFKRTICLTTAPFRDSNEEVRYEYGGFLPRTLNTASKFQTHLGRLDQGYHLQGRSRSQQKVSTEGFCCSRDTVHTHIKGSKERAYCSGNLRGCVKSKTNTFSRRAPPEKYRSTAPQWRSESPVSM